MQNNIFITGHTGKNGAKLSKILAATEAKVTGFALPSCDKVEVKGLISMFGDIRSKSQLETALMASNPEIIIHLAKMKATEDPFSAFEANVMGTLNLLEAAKNLENLKKIIILDDNKKNQNNGIPSATDQAMSIAVGSYIPLFNNAGATLKLMSFKKILTMVEAREI